MFNQKKTIQPDEGAQPQAHVALTDDGVMIMRHAPGGEFESVHISVAGPMSNAGCHVGGPWANSATIALATEPASGEPGCQVKLQMTVRCKNSEASSVPILVITGEPGEVEAVSGQLRQAWISANFGSLQANDVGMSPAAWGSARGSERQRDTRMESPGSRDGASRHLMRGPRSRVVVWGGGLLVVGGVLFGAYFAASKYLQPSGPSIDMTAMSIEDLAAMDSNPEAIRSVQSTMIEALNHGREQGAREAGKIEEAHIKALQELGLDPGKSMANAVSCLK